jgi:ABC-type phosphate/phosphonate transport system substrate-binding protein
MVAGLMMTLLLPASRGPEEAAARSPSLQSALTEHLGQPVRVEVAPDYAELERRLLSGEVELAWAPPVLCARAEPTARAILCAIRVGRSSYRSALVGRAAEGLLPTGLQGRRAAWADPLSTAGYLLPLAFLRLLGQEPEQLFSSQRFLGSYRATLQAVAAGEADVTAIYTPRAEAQAVAAQMAELLGAQAAALAPIAFTEEVPADGLVLSDRVSAHAAPALLQALLWLGSAQHGPNPLLEALSAQRLVQARAGEYRPLRAARLTRPGRS